MKTPHVISALSLRPAGTLLAGLRLHGLNRCWALIL
jgi:hypothetical protein